MYPLYRVDFWLGSASLILPIFTVAAMIWDTVADFSSGNLNRCLKLWLFILPSTSAVSMFRCLGVTFWFAHGAPPQGPGLLSWEGWELGEVGALAGCLFIVGLRRDRVCGDGSQGNYGNYENHRSRARCWNHAGRARCWRWGRWGVACSAWHCGGRCGLERPARTVQYRVQVATLQQHLPLTDRSVVGV